MSSKVHDHTCGIVYTKKVIALYWHSYAAGSPRQAKIVLMKAQFEDIASKKGAESFLAYAFNVPYFEFKWHYHPGNMSSRWSRRRWWNAWWAIRNESYTSGDLVLLGSELPHTWTSETLQDKTVSAVVVQFPHDFIHRFSDWKSLSPSKRYWLHLGEPVLSWCSICPPNSNYFRHVRCWKDRRDQHSPTPEHPAAPEAFVSSFHPVKGEKTESRVNKVCQYIQKHSDKPLCL